MFIILYDVETSEKQQQKLRSFIDKRRCRDAFNDLLKQNEVYIARAMEIDIYGSCHSLAAYEHGHGVWLEKWEK